MQLTVQHDEAAKRAEAAGLKVVMNRCPKIEYGRLSSEISWFGVNSRTLSSKRAQGYGSGVQRMALERRKQRRTKQLAAPRTRRRHSAATTRRWLRYLEPSGPS